MTANQGVRVYGKYERVGPPTLGEHLAKLAFEYSYPAGYPNIAGTVYHELDRDVRALREAFQVGIAGQREAISELLTAKRNDPSAAADQWDHNYGDGYRSWLGDMDAALDMLGNIPEEPRFD